VSLQDLPRRHAELSARKQRGELSDAAFQAELGQLRAQDADGTWWQMDAQGRWLRWDGSAWHVGAPPEATLAPGATAGQPGPDGAAGRAGRAGAWSRQAARLAMRATSPAAMRRAMAQFERRTLDPQEFLRQARHVPWSRRSQGFWDLLAILGGATGGYLWFVYSSVRGLPLPRLFYSGGRASLFDFFPTLGLLALPLLLVLFRRPLAAALQPLWLRLQQRTARERLVALALIASPFVFLYVWPSIDPWVFPLLFQAREGVDVITPVLTTAIPLLLVWFRRETDALLRPFQPLRQRVPRGVLVGVGLVVPFLISGVVYAVGFAMPWGLRNLFFIEYRYLRVCVVLGTLVSYAILRTPQGASLPGPGTGNGMAGHPAVRLLLTIGLAGLSGSVWADDFFSDPFNLNDGLRTNSVAPIIAGAVTTVITVLVNGAEVVQVILQGVPPPGADEDAPRRKDFHVVVDSVDAAGARSTRLARGSSPFVHIYAHCEEVGKGRFPAGDSTITFAAQFDTSWATLDDLGTAHGRRCARVSLVEPPPQGAPPPALVVLVSAGQAVSGVPVTLRLEAEEWVLELR
jgi:hypothetical protein